MNSNPVLKWPLVFFKNGLFPSLFIALFCLFHRVNLMQLKINKIIDYNQSALFQHGVPSYAKACL